MNIAEMRQRLADIAAELDEFDPEQMDDDQSARFDTLDAEARQLAADIDKAEARAARIDEIRQAASNPAATERAVPDTVRVGSTDRGDDRVQDVLSRWHASPTEYRDAALSALEKRDADDRVVDGVDKMMRRHMNEDAGPLTRHWARQIVGRSTRDYERAFAKYLRNPQNPLWTEDEARAIAVGTNTQGGFLVPTHLDPTVILTNDGSGNELRGIARVVTLTEGNTWNGVTSAGVSASFDAEFAEVSDDSPALVGPSIPVHTARAFVGASIEAFQDASLQADVLNMFADARERLEGAKYMTGSGSAEPTGIFTALDANTNVEIVSTTAATIGLVDLNSVYKGVPKRFRGRSTWVLHPTYNLAVKNLGTAVSASYTTDLTQAPSDAILGRPVVESDDAPDTQTTTALDNEIVFGDFSNFVIVDKPGSTSVEFIPHLFGTTNGRPIGQRGWFAHWRTGSDSVVDTAFRLLQDKTSA